jgi:hypothetical protein
VNGRRVGFRSDPEIAAVARARFKQNQDYVDYLAGRTARQFEAARTEVHSIE